MAPAKLKVLPEAEVVNTTVQDLLTLASDARALADRIETLGDSCRRTCRGIRETTEEEVAALSPSPFPALMRIEQLVHEANLKGTVLLQFEAVYTEGQTLRQMGREQVGLAVPATATVEEIDLSRVRHEQLGTLRLALLTLEDKLNHWAPYAITFRVTVLRHVQAAALVVTRLTVQDVSGRLAAIKRAVEQIREAAQSPRTDPFVTLAERVGAPSLLDGLPRIVWPAATGQDLFTGPTLA